MSSKIQEHIAESERLFDEKFSSAPSIASNEDEQPECCNCGEDLSLEWYEAFSEGYEMASQDIKSFLKQRELALVERIKEEIEYKAHFSKLAGSRYDGYISINDIKSLLETNKE